MCACVEEIFFSPEFLFVSREHTLERKANCENPQNSQSNQSKCRTAPSELLPPPWRSRAFVPASWTTNPPTVPRTYISTDRFRPPFLSLSLFEQNTNASSRCVSRHYQTARANSLAALTTAVNSDVRLIYSNRIQPPCQSLDWAGAAPLVILWRPRVFGDETNSPRRQRWLIIGVAITRTILYSERARGVRFEFCGGWKCRSGRNISRPQ